MKKSKLLFGGIALSLALTACSSGSGETGVRASTKPYMTVDGAEISSKDYYKQYDFFASIYALNQNLGNSVSSMMVRDQFITNDLEKNGVTIPEEEYKTQIDEAIENLGGQESYEEYLDFMGIDEELFEQNIKNNYKNTKHQEWYTSKHPVSEEDINAYYEENKSNLDYVEAKHILVADEETAKQVKARLDAGEDFKTVSDELSIDEAAKQRGGELGRVNRAMYDPTFVDAAFALEPGTTSEPVQTQHGFHIIQVSSSNIGAENHKDQIEDALEARKHSEYVQSSISQLDVKLFDRNGEEVSNVDQQNIPGNNNN